MIGWLVTKQPASQLSRSGQTDWLAGYQTRDGVGGGWMGIAIGETQTESRALFGGRALVSLKKSLSIVVKLRVLCRAQGIHIVKQENTYDQLSTTLNFYIF